MYNIFYYKEDTERQITVENIYSLRDIAFLLTKAKIYFKVYQRHFPIDCSAIGFQDKGFWLGKEKDYFKEKDKREKYKMLQTVEVTCIGCVFGEPNGCTRGESLKDCEQVTDDGTESHFIYVKDLEE